MQNAISSRHPKYRTKLCRNFVSGDCPFGQECSFLHPAPSIDPSAFSLGRHLLTWNPLLLSQLLALSNQQETLKKMPRQSSLCPQGPQLVDEDPSQTTSLLLSKSDSTSSDQVPQTRRSSRRKKYPCRHFIRTGGWCPAAGQCKFRHDVAALPSAGVWKAEHAPPLATDGHGEGRTISGGVLMSTQSPSPPIVNQAHSDPPQYIEPEPTERYQPVYWPNYTWRPHYATVPVPTTGPPSVVAQQSVYPQTLPQCQAQSVYPNETQTNLPLGSYEVNGTTYFPTSTPSVSAPPPVPYSIPVHPPLSYNHPTVPAHPYYAPAPPVLPACYYDVANPTTDVGSQISTTFDPFASERMMPSDLPVIPRLEDYQISPIQRDALALPLSGPSPLVASGKLGLTSSTDTSGKPTVSPDHEFPYRPPKEQRVGHARRISVNIKKHARVNSG